MANDEFGSEGVIPGTGTIGQDEEDWANNIMNDPSNAQVVMYYGISALSVVGFSVIMYFVLNGYSNAVRGTYWGFVIHQICWWPVGMLWIGIAFWDAQWLRKIYVWAVTISFLGPFAGYWVALAFIIVHANATNDWGWQTWVAIPLWIGYTIFSMIMQVVMVPKIYTWAGDAPVNHNENDLAAGLLSF